MHSIESTPEPAAVSSRWLASLPARVCRDDGQDYAAAANAFLCGENHPTIGRSFRDCGYLPMIELLRRLA
jgi:hypothetical protein